LPKLAACATARCVHAGSGFKLINRVCGVVGRTQIIRKCLHHRALTPKKTRT
jgi:hypothetical protein